ncbi:hypothetical protein FISHEDRAFT_46276, partial [Fistulina hepatica ATCC 64428]
SLSTMTRPEPEVIVSYLDGCAYNKTKMEEAFRPGGFLEKPVPTKHAHAKDHTVKADDVDIIVNEFEISRAQAERVLKEHGGDIEKTIETLINS